MGNNPKFFVDSKFFRDLRSLCSGGHAIMGANKCKEACKTLNLPQMTISGNHLCYKDNEGKCYQDGQERWARNRYGVSLICEKVGLQLENGEGSSVGGYGFRAENGGYGMGGGYGSGSAADDDAFAMGGGYRSGSAADDDHDEDRMGGYGGVRHGMGGGYGGGSGSAADDDHDEDRMGGYGGVRHGMGGGYGGGSEGGVGGLRGGYGSEFGNGAQACLDELPSDYKDSICYKEFEETSCEKIATDASHCGILWRDTGCSQHGGYVRDTCRKSCGVCKNSGHFRNLQTGWTGVEGGRPSYAGCDVRNGVQGNRDCPSGERCVKEFGNAGFCEP